MARVVTAVLLELLAVLLLAACGGADPVVPPTPAQVLAHRTYLLDIPPGHDPAVPAPLLVLLHGAGGSAYSVVEDLHLEAATARGILVARPDGVVNSTGYWNATGNKRSPFDEIFLAALVEDVAGKVAVDRARVWILGYSIGAFMAHRMGCVAAGVYGAVVGLAGLVSTAPGFCAPGAPVSVLDIHGDLDAVITYDGAPFVGDPPRQTSPSAHDTVALWAGVDGCTGALSPGPGPLDLDGKVGGSETQPEGYGGCPAGIDVALWTLHGSGHYPDLTDAFAPAVLDWLAGHPRP